MSTFIQLIVEVTTGDDAAFEPAKQGDDIAVVVGPEWATPHTASGDVVKAQLHSWAYVAEESLP